MPRHQLFVSYNSADAEAVQAVRRAIEARGVTTFLDRRDLPPGLPWMERLEQALGEVEAVAVFLGPHGLGRIQKREMYFAIDRQSAAGATTFPVIPVLLPGVEEVASGFLSQNTWIDLRPGLETPEALAALVAAVRGEGATWSEAAAAGEEAAGEAAAAAPALPAVCPYRSLRYFREEDSAFFFGRERESERLFEVVGRRGLVAVVGPSGSGKSSLVRAGLLPRLRRQRPPRPGWEIALANPVGEPFHRLAAALVPLLEPDLGEVDRLAEGEKLGRRLAAGEVRLGPVVERVLARSGGSDRLLLVVDQLEELFTQTPEGQRRPFAELLLAAADAPLTLLLALRGDFYGHAIGLHPQLPALLEQGTVNVGPIDEEGLERAVVEPARRVGLGFEPGLVRRILDDVGAEPGRLPLLEFALARLWEERQGRLLTHAGYETVGEVSGAIAQRAEEVFAALGEDERQALRRTFSRLVRLARPEEGADDSRRRLPLTELEPAARPLVRRLADERLLVTGRDPATGAKAAEVAHEALIREWRRLSGWLDEDRAFLLWRQGLAPAAAAWRQHPGDPSYLLAGTRLAQAEELAAGRAGELSTEEAAFLATSAAWRDAEQAAEAERRRRELERERALTEEQRKRAEAERQRAEAEREGAEVSRRETRRVRRFAAGLAVLLVAAAGLIVLVLVLRSQVAERERLRTAQLLARQAEEVAGRYPQRAVLLAAAAVRTSLDHDEPLEPAAESALRKALAGCGGIPLLHPDPRVQGAVLGEKGRWLATATALDGADSLLRLTRLTEEADVGEPLDPFDTGGRLDLRFSPDGAWLATEGDNQTTVVWRLGENGAERAFETPSNRPELAWSPDGKLLVTGARDGAVHLWDLATGPPWPKRILHEPELGTGTLVRKLVVSPDRRWVAALTAADEVLLWDLVDGERLYVPHASRHHLAFSPDSSALVLGGDNGVELVDLTPGGDGQSLNLPREPIRHLAFSPQGLLFAATGEEVYFWKTPYFWRESRPGAATPQSQVLAGRPLTDGQGEWLAAMAGNRLTVAALDPRPLGDGQSVLLVSALAGHDGEVRDLAFDPAVRWLLAWTAAGQARRWELERETLGAGLEPRRLGRGGIEFLPALLYPCSLGVLGAELVAVVEASSSEPQPLATVFSLQSDGAARPRPLECPGGSAIAALAPGGAWVGVVTDSGEVCRWPLSATGRQLAPAVAALGEEPGLLLRSQQYGLGLEILALSGDGEWLAAARRDLPWAWAGRIGDSLRQILQGGTSRAGMATLAFDAAGSRLAGARSDGRVFLWDLSGPAAEEAVPLLPRHDGQPGVLAFSLDGRWLLSGAEGDGGRLWDLSTEDRDVVVSPAQGVASAAFGATGRRLAIGGREGAVHLLDLTREPPARLGPPLPLGTAPIAVVAFDSGGEHLFAVGDRGAARLWDLTDDDPEATAVEFPDLEGTSAAVFHPEGDWLATAGEDGVTLWDLDLDSLLAKACRAAGRNLTCGEWREALGDEPYRPVCRDLPGPPDASRPGAANPCG